MSMPMPRLRQRLLHPMLLLLLPLIANVCAQGNFEDADKANDYTDQKFDLRHTIPGEPGIDYPILSEVPKTSFVCKDRHEGYYADVESRCQAFRICAHTARSAQGFGFLCPNGTIFSQQKFVCDWYRNVDCDASERYYDMNREHRVGSTQQMMERVRQMMEYPTLTISKALQQPQQQQHQHQHKHQTLSKDLSSASGVLSQPATVNSGKSPLRGEEIKSEALPAPVRSEHGDSNSAEDIYVNSLGELSSDPGIQFDHTNAHIIAEYPREYHYQKQQNFAERVNAGLEDLPDDPTAAANSHEQMAPDYIKQIRNTKEEGTQLDLVSNINNLLEEVSTDLDPSVSGYQLMAPQKAKQPFRFLSRGFTMQSSKDNSKSSSSSSSSYLYNRPKQTASTVRFTPNEIPTDAAKDTEHKLKFNSNNNNNNDKVTTTTTSSTLTTTTEPPITTETIEELLIAPTLPPIVPAEEVEVDTTTTSTTTTTTITTEPSTVELNYSSEVPFIESIGQAAVLTVTHQEPLAQEQEEQIPLSPATADKADVHLQAEKLLVAGVKLTSHDEEAAVRTNRLTLGRPTTTITPPTTTPTPPTTSSSSSPIVPKFSARIRTTATPMSTSTEVVTEISSTQERIRSYRRFAHKRVGGALKRNPTAAASAPTATTKVTTTERSAITTTPTRSYLERLAASRLRLSRLSLATRPTKAKATSTTSAATAATPTTATVTATTATTPLALVRDAEDSGPNKKLSVRNIDRETGQPQKANWDSVQSNLQRFQVQRGNRVYTPATRAAPTSSSSSSSISISSPRPTTAATVQRGRNRHSNYRTQAPVQRTRATTTPRTATTTAASATQQPQYATSAALSTLSQQISALASGYSYTPPPLNPNPSTHINTYNNIASSAVAQTQTVSSIVAPQQQLQTQPQPQTQTTSSLSPSTAFLPFDKLTRAIVDDSILQNFKSTHSQQQQQHQQPQQHQHKQQQQQRIAKPATSNAVSSSYNYPKPAIAAAAPALSSLPIPQRPQQQQLPQIVLPTQPGIIIARAEGQRISPNSANNIISSLISQPQTKSPQGNSYVTLKDFLNNKFGQSASSNSEHLNVASPTNLKQNYQGLQQQQQQQHQRQQQPLQQQTIQHPFKQQQPQQQQQLSYITQRYQQQPHEQTQQHQQQPQQHQQQQHRQQQYQPQQQHFHAQQQQHLPQPQQHKPQQQQQQQQQHTHQQHFNYQPHYQQHTYQQQQQQQHTYQQQPQRSSIQSIQQPYLTPNIFVPYQQQQQHLPLFPPLATGATGTAATGAALPAIGKTSHVSNGHHQVDHLNVQLPALPNGLIPAATLQIAQKRSDIKANQLQYGNSNSNSHSNGSKSAGRDQEVAFYSGRTSYQVPQSSVGRLQNDITHLMRYRQRRQ